MRPMAAGSMVTRAVTHPIRAAASAASMPACPPPTTTTSYLCFTWNIHRLCYSPMGKHSRSISRARCERIHDLGASERRLEVAASPLDYRIGARGVPRLGLSLGASTHRGVPRLGFSKFFDPPHTPRCTAQASTEWRNLAGASLPECATTGLRIPATKAPAGALGPMPNAYFPMQNRSKMWLSTSSDDTSPVISASGGAASRMSNARYSSVDPARSPPSARSSDAEPSPAHRGDARS